MLGAFSAHQQLNHCLEIQRKIKKNIWLLKIYVMPTQSMLTRTCYDAYSLFLLILSKTGVCKVPALT